jgi:23S rRNA pseudouridine1911/1915/1917 synthase
VLNVIYEDNHLLVVNKPAGLVTQGATAGEPSLVTVAADYIKHKYAKPGNVYIGVVSRLDAAVSGVIVLARTSKAAERLNAQFRTREVEKTYWGLVSGTVAPPSGRLVDWLAKDERLQRVVRTTSGSAGAQEAVLSYQAKGRIAGGSWLEISLETGRKHQIRVQLSVRGWPILGDKKYGSQHPFSEGIALHARAISFAHPVKQETLTFSAPVPTAWREFGVFK